MNQFITPTNLHHGYLIIGDRETSKKSLFDFLENKLDIQTVGNPDFSFSEYNTLTIDDARLIAHTQERKDFGSDKKVFAIATHIMTDEAQNALLKVFEEPTPGTHFFILASQNTFLPTFLSRLMVLRSDTNIRMHANDTNDEENILEKSLPERLALVAKLAGDISDEKRVKQDAIDLVNTIERELMEQGGVEKNSGALIECQNARIALFSRGAMIKMILENLMLQI